MWSKESHGYDSGGIPDDWRPNIPDVKSDPIEKLKAFICAVRPIIEKARTVPDESKAIDGKITIQIWQVPASSSVWNEIVKSYDDVKFK